MQQPRTAADFPREFRRILLELAREPGHPAGDHGYGYVFVAPLDAEDVLARLDAVELRLEQVPVRVEHVQVRAPELPLFDTVEVGTAKMSVWVNPLILQLAVGTDF